MLIQRSTYTHWTVEGGNWLSLERIKKKNNNNNASDWMPVRRLRADCALASWFTAFSRRHGKCDRGHFADARTRMCKTR